MSAEGGILICHRGAIGDFLLTWPALSSLRKLLPDVPFAGVGRPDLMRLAVKMGLLGSFHDAERADMMPFFKGESLPPGMLPPAGAVLWLKDARRPASMLRRTARLPVAVIRPFPAEKVHVAVHHLRSLASYYPIDTPPDLNPAASAFPAACRGVSERMMFEIPSLGIEDPPELAPESFNSCFPSPDLRRGCDVLIHPGSGGPAKVFPAALYLEIRRLLRESGFQRVKFILGPVEIDRGLSSLCDGGESIRPDDLCELAEHLSRARLYIGNDSGVSHLAGILGVPAVAFFRSTDPAIWGILGPEARNYRVESEQAALNALKRYLHTTIEGVGH